MRVLRQQLQQAEFVRTVWAVKPEPGVTLDQMLQPESWTHVAKVLKKGDRIEITAADDTWFAELYVLSVSENDARVALLTKTAFADLQTKAPDATDVEVKHRGAAGWSAIRKSDKAILIEGRGSKKEVEDWLAKHFAENLE